MTATKLFSFWQTSVQIFTNCDQRKNFILGTLSIWRRALITLIKKFWWLFMIFPELCMISDYFYLPTINYLLETMIVSGFLYLGLMSLRPSIEIKDYAYFYRYSLTFVIITGINLITPTLVWQVIFVPILICILFVLDSKITPTSLVASFKKTCVVTTYCLPTVVVITALFSLIGTLITIPLGTPSFIEFQWNLFLNLLISPLFFLIKLFFLATITTYYVKLKHEHYNLFFK